MNTSSTATVWPFAIVESRLIVSPDFLVERGRSDARIRRLLINQARVDQARGQALHRSVLTIADRERFALAYRYVPVPGGARDEATRPLHMAEGLICDRPDAAITDETLDRSRDQLREALERYVAHGWSGPPAASHGEPLNGAAPAAEAASTPPTPRRWQDTGRPAVLTALIAATAGLVLLVLMIRRLLTA
ncbi:hypothetical protein ACQP2X_25535 [Actinoplanes sp. CA-131856]